jgi:hypothetical protein
MSDERLERMEAKIDQGFDKLDTRLDKQVIILDRLTSSVEHHVKRTDLLESQVAPIVEHVKAVGILIKVTTGVVAFLVTLKALNVF